MDRLIIKALKSFCLVFIISFLFTCEEGNDVISRTSSEQLTYDISRIKGYIKENNLSGFSETSTGLHYKITETGTGKYPTLGDTLYVHYVGQFLNGQQFDKSNSDLPFEFILGQGVVIQGWEEGTRLLDKEGTGIFLLPSSLGYGKSPPSSSTIPPNSVLVFAMDLVDVK